MLHITPQNNTIEFQLQIENASLKETSTRLIVNTKNENIISSLSIDDKGNCKGIIPLKEEWNGQTGKVKIEVIAEGTYFEPFSKEVIFDSIPKAPKAKINEIILSPSKPKLPPKSTPIIKEVKDNNKKIILDKPKTVSKPKITKKPISKSLIRKKTIEKPKPILKTPKPEPVLEYVKPKPILKTPKPEFKIESEISNEVKSFFSSNKPKKIIKENKIKNTKKIEENITKEAKNFFKSL
jgi:hypothetical protein